MKNIFPYSQKQEKVNRWVARKVALHGSFLHSTLSKPIAYSLRREASCLDALSLTGHLAAYLSALRCVLSHYPVYSYETGH